MKLPPLPPWHLIMMAEIVTLQALFTGCTDRSTLLLKNKPIPLTQLIWIRGRPIICTTARVTGTNDANGHNFEQDYES